MSSIRAKYFGYGFVTAVALGLVIILIIVLTRSKSNPAPGVEKGCDFTQYQSIPTGPAPITCETSTHSEVRVRRAGAPNTCPQYAIFPSSFC